MKRRIEILETENQRLQAEVARQEQDIRAGETREKRDFGRVQELKAEVAELETINQVLIDTKISIHQATEAALRWAWEHPGYGTEYRIADDYIDHGLAALLEEK